MMRAIALPFATAALFFAECAIFHLPVAAGLDALWLATLILIPGISLVSLLERFRWFTLTDFERISLGGGIGFCLPPLLLGFFHLIGIRDAALPMYLVLGAI